MDEIPLQDRFGADDICFGCGPTNPRGLRVKSRVHGDEVVADWTPGPDLEAFLDAVLSSGGVTTATATSTFIAVRPDHPAYGTR